MRKVDATMGAQCLHQSGHLGLQDACGDDEAAGPGERPQGRGYRLQLADQHVGGDHTRLVLRRTRSNACQCRCVGPGPPHPVGDPVAKGVGQANVLTSGVELDQVHPSGSQQRCSDAEDP